MGEVWLARHRMLARPAGGHPQRPQTGLVINRVKILLGDGEADLAGVEAEDLGGRVRVQIHNRLMQRQVVVRCLRRRDNEEHDDCQSSRGDN